MAFGIRDIPKYCRNLGDLVRYETVIHGAEMSSHFSLRG